MAMNLTELKKELSSLSKSRVYWFRSGNFEELAAPWLVNPSDTELSRLQAKINNYLQRNPVLRFFEWLFSSIEHDLRLLAYYQTKKMLAQSSSPSEEQKQNLRHVLSAMHSSSSWKILLQAFLTLIGGVAIPSAAIPVDALALRPVAMRIESFPPIDRIECYETLGIANPAMAGLDEIVKAYREKVRSFHPDRGGNKEIFAKLTQAYLLAVYIRVHYFEEKDSRGILKEEDLPALSSESEKHFASIQHLILGYLKGRIAEIRALAGRASEMATKAVDGSKLLAEQMAKLATELRKEGRLPLAASDEEPEPVSTAALRTR